MISHAKKPRVASLTWDRESELHEIQLETIRDLGYPAQLLSYNSKIPDDIDIILVTGPYGSLSPLVAKISNLQPNERPVLALWFEESLNMLRPEPVRRGLALAFSELRWNGLSSNFLNFLRPNILESTGKRLGFLGDILWLHDSDLLDVLALSSSVYADYLGRLGIPSLLVPRGFHPGYGEHLGLERDIAVTWLGKLRTGRRAHAVRHVLNRVQQMGYEVRLHDGVERDFIYGEERTDLLNRSWFVLNVNFSGPTDELSLRYIVAAANGAVILTEPNRNEYSFVPGVHLVESQIKDMPRQVDHFIRNPSAWQEISQNMRTLMESELTLRESIERILREAERVLARKELR